MKLNFGVYRNSRYPENHVYLWQDTDKLYHRKLYLVHLAIIVIRTHNLK